MRQDNDLYFSDDMQRMADTGVLFGITLYRRVEGTATLYRYRRVYSVGNWDAAKDWLETGEINGHGDRVIYFDGLMQEKGDSDGDPAKS